MMQYIAFVSSGAPAAGSIPVPAGSMSLTGFAPTVKTTAVIPVPNGSLTLTGIAPLVKTPRVVAVPSGSLSLTGIAPTISSGDPNFSSVALLLNFAGSDGSTTFNDTSPVARPALSVSGNAQINSHDGLFDGTGDYLSTNITTGFDFLSGDWTIEAFIKPTSVSGIDLIITNRAPSGSDRGFMFFMSSGTLALQAWGPTAGTVIVNFSGGSVSTGSYQHVCAQRIGNDFRLSVGGVLTASSASSAQMVTSGNAIEVGRDPSTSGREFDGRMRALRVTKSVARYPSFPFTPPAVGSFPES